MFDLTEYNVIHLGVALAMTVFFFYVLGDFIYRFIHVPASIAEHPTLFQRLLSAGQGSITFWWGRFIASIGASLGIVAALADLLNDQTISDGIRTYLTPYPGYVALFVIVVGVVTYVARSRTMVKPEVDTIKLKEDFLDQENSERPQGRGKSR